MSSETLSLSDKLARGARVILLGGIAVILALIVVSPRGSSTDPLSIPRAHADISAAPGYLMLTMNTGANSKLYINDTNKQVICVYEVTGDKLRLVSARKYDYDSTIFDMSIPMAGKVPEGGNGLNREQTKAYGETIKKGFEDFQKRNKLN
ncbi:MAG TPA: hypothetical protein VEK08_12075 [Planctomycetota bacterium]|nr:hypothetical protein [Planctomycetota bacterium]